jgi:beta-N-acetylhexosaminidase
VFREIWKDFSLRFFALCQRVLIAGLCLNGATTSRAETAPTLDQMIGQMLIVGFTGTQTGDVGVKTARQQIAEGVIGGVILLPRNIEDPAQLLALTQSLNQPNLPAPAFIAVDQEGGRVQRLPPAKGFSGWDSATEVQRSAKTGSKDFTLRYYSVRAQKLHAVGVNLNFAPVVDVNVNPANPIIGKLGRSYSKDSAMVADIAADFVRAHRASGVLTSLKHFPGHGSSAGDSHKSLPSIAKSWSADELTPYKTLAREGLVDMVMMGHLYHPDFSDAKGVPSSVSRKGVGALRQIIGPSAVIVTDDLQMQAVHDLYSDPEAAVQAVLAGDDVLLFSADKHPDPMIGPKINASLKQAVLEGRISQSRIEESYARILRLKQGI